MAEFHTPIYEELPEGLDTLITESASTSAYDTDRAQAIAALEQGTLSSEQERIVLGRLAAQVSQDYN